MARTLVAKTCPSPCTVATHPPVHTPWVCHASFRRLSRYLGEGPKLVRELFRVADEHAPSIVFIDEIDAVGSKRYDSQSGGTREIQRTMLELLNQLDGFDERGDVKVWPASEEETRGAAPVPQ